MLFKYFYTKGGIAVAVLLFLINKKFVCNSIVEPNVNSAEFQDSYGVKKAEDLVTKLFDNAGEYYNLLGYL